MWLDKAEEYFDIRFSAHGRIGGLVRKLLGRP
jgi:hypothetical protein